MTTEIEVAEPRLWSSWVMANKIVESGQCFHAVVSGAVLELG
ncbi:MAG: hypothetical protein AB1733_09230 [Thermodesulfobacteriota bacterium]